MLTITWGKTLYKAKIKATFKINLNVAFNMSKYDKQDFSYKGYHAPQKFQAVSNENSDSYRP